MEIFNMQNHSQPAICHRFTRWPISRLWTEMKNDTSYSSPPKLVHTEERKNARPMGLRRTHVNSETGKAGPEFKVRSHQEGAYAVYWSMSQSHQCTSRTEIPYTLCSIFKASGQRSTNAHVSVYIFNTSKWKEPIWPSRHIGYNFSLIHSWIWNRLNLVGCSHTAVTGEIWPSHGEPLFPGESTSFPQLTSAVDPLSKSQYDALPLLCSL